MDPQLQRQLDEMTEDAVNDWIEQKHTHEVVTGDYEDLDVDEPDPDGDLRTVIR